MTRTEPIFERESGRLGKTGWSREEKNGPEEDGGEYLSGRKWSKSKNIREVSGVGKEPRNGVGYSRGKDSSGPLRVSGRVQK